MIRILKKYLLLCSLLFSVMMVARVPLKIDSTRVSPLEISKETEQKIFSDKDYVYKEEEAKRGRNFIQDLIDWFTRNQEDEREREDRENNEYEESTTGSRSFWDSRTVGNFMILLCIIAVVGGLVYLFVTGKFKRVFQPKPVEMSFDFKEVTENIEEMNIDRLIEEARKKGDYRLATRWWYLKILKKLTMENLISWKPYKTNFDYYRELQNTTYISGFKEASHVYEYVWYGQFDVTEDTYNKYTPQLDAFEKSIHA